MTFCLSHVQPRGLYHPTVKAPAVQMRSVNCSRPTRTLLVKPFFKFNVGQMPKRSFNTKVLSPRLSIGIDFKTIDLAKLKTICVVKRTFSNNSRSSAKSHLQEFLDARCNEGNTALHIGVKLDCENSRFDICKILLESGAKPNIPDNRGWTPLDTAVESSVKTKSLKMISLLVQHGAEHSDIYLSVPRRKEISETLLARIVKNKL